MTAAVGDTLLLAEAVAIDGEVVLLILGVLLVMVAVSCVYVGVLNVFGYRFARTGRTRDGLVWAVMSMPPVAVAGFLAVDGRALTALPIVVVGVGSGYTLGRFRGPAPADQGDLGQRDPAEGGDGGPR